VVCLWNKSYSSVSFVEAALHPRKNFWESTLDLRFIYFIILNLQDTSTSPYTSTPYTSNTFPYLAREPRSKKMAATNNDLNNTNNGGETGHYDLSVM